MDSACSCINICSFVLFFFFLLNIFKKGFVLENDFTSAGWTADELISVFSHLCPQQINSLIHSNLAEIVVELLMTLYEGSGAEGELGRFVG